MTTLDFPNIASICSLNSSRQPLVFSAKSKALFLKAACASTCLLTGLCGWDSHILTLTSTRRLSALLCPALFINIFLSTQDNVRFSI